MFPLLEGFYYSTPMGQLTLSELTKSSLRTACICRCPDGIGGFYGAEKVEKYFAAKDAESVK
jgi:hypothetical protein